MEDLSIVPDHWIYDERIRQRYRRMWDRRDRPARPRFSRSPLVDSEIPVMKKETKLGFTSRTFISEPAEILRAIRHLYADGECQLPMGNAQNDIESQSLMNSSTVLDGESHLPTVNAENEIESESSMNSSTVLDVESQLPTETSLSLKDRMRLRWNKSSLRRFLSRMTDIVRRTCYRCYRAVMTEIYALLGFNYQEVE